MPTAKHIPIRQCLVCRSRRAKRELLRIVNSEAGVFIDPSGRKPGRGAYVCPDKPECWAEKKLRRFAGTRAAELSGALYALLSVQAGQTGGPEQEARQKG